MKVANYPDYESGQLYGYDDGQLYGYPKLANYRDMKGPTIRLWKVADLYG